MKITRKNLHIFIVLEVALFNLLIAPFSLNHIKDLYSNYNMTGSYLIIVGSIIIISNSFKKYVKPIIVKYYSKNKKLKLLCDLVDVGSCDTKKIFKLEKSEVMGSGLVS